MRTIYKTVKAWFGQLQKALNGAPVVEETLEPGIRVSFQSDAKVLSKFYREILEECFHNNDLDSRRLFISNVRSGEYVVLLVEEVNETGINEILGGIVIEHSWSMDKKIMLIAWVGVRENHRGRDIGTLLVSEAISYAKSHKALMLLGEVENPEKFEEEDSGYGNPTKRVKFYSRFDCKRLEVPYVVQVGGGVEEFGMMLTLFPLSEEQAAAAEIYVPEFALFVQELVGMDGTDASEALIESSIGVVKMTPYRKLYSS